VAIESLPFQLDKNDELKGVEKERTTTPAGTMGLITRVGDPSLSKDTTSQITDPVPSWVDVSQVMEGHPERMDMTGARRPRGPTL
jgi:hypothetical protein